MVHVEFNFANEDKIMCEMEKKTLIKDIKTAAAKLKDGKLKTYKTIQPALERIVKELNLASTDEAMMFVAVFDRHCDERTSDISDLANYFDSSSLAVMEYQACLASMADKGILRHDNEDEFRMRKMAFAIPDALFEDIVGGREIRKNLVGQKEYTAFDFINAVHNIIEARHSNSISTSKLLSLVENLEKKHSEIDFVKTIMSLESVVDNRTILYESCKDFIDNFERGASGIGCTLDDIFEKPEVKARQRKELIESTHPLVEKGLIEIHDKDEMAVTKKTLAMLFGELANSFKKSMQAKDVYEFVQNIATLASDLDDADTYGKLTFYKKLQVMEDENPHLEFIIKLKNSVPDFDFRLIFYMVANELVSGDTYLLREIGDLFTKSQEMHIMRNFKEERTVLQTRKLVELSSDSMFGYSELSLTDKGKELFLGEDADLFIESVSGRDIIKHTDVQEKKLFFTHDLDRQLDRVAESLNEKNYHDMCTRLKEKHLPTGVAALLYGHPGTGKTETVMQIARQTGRDIMHVDISSTKSCWFGESEKIIKGVFEKYRSLCKKSKVKPILLFNEADGVFGKRKDSNSSNVAQTENAIQNIILEEMEKLDGILIATTNLADNFDKAFERRFLFKIHFDKPTIEAKTNIWLNKLPSLDKLSAERLAEQFDFSGGEIDNIARKATMDEIVGGIAPSYESLLTLCKEEKIGKSKSSRVGFV